MSADLLPEDPDHFDPAGLIGRGFALARPSQAHDPLRRAVRGDLAHIRYVGRIFVPHYAVPMPHRVGAAGAGLRRTGRDDGEVLAQIAAGTVFNVLDIAGAWAWGQVGEDGLVGYVPAAMLEAA